MINHIPQDEEGAEVQNPGGGTSATLGSTEVRGQKVLQCSNRINDPLLSWSNVMHQRCEDFIALDF